MIAHALNRMPTEVLTSPRDLTTELRAAWRELALGASLPYSTPEWMLAFFERHHRHHDPDAELRVVVVRDAGTVVGVGPFVCGRPGRGLRELGLLASGIGQRSGPLAREGREREVGAAIAAALGADSVDALALEGVDARSGLAEAIASGWRNRVGRARLVTDRVEPAPSVTLRADGDHEAWMAGLSRNFRSQLRRRRRAVEERGGVVRRSGDARAMTADLDALVELHRERFIRLGKATALDAVRARAVSAAVQAMAAQGLVRLWVVEAGARVVGAQVFFTAGRRMAYFNGGTSEAWARESLGLVLLEQAIRDGHELGLGTLDLGGGDQPYKQRFADQDEPVAWRAVIPWTARAPLVHARRVPALARTAARRALTARPGRAA